MVLTCIAEIKSEMEKEKRRQVSEEKKVLTPEEIA